MDSQLFSSAFGIQSTRNSPYAWPYQGLEGGDMARTRPFLCCRYEFTTDDESLDTSGQLSILQELQGQPIKAADARVGTRYLDSIVMRPRKHSWQGHTVL